MSAIGLALSSAGRRLMGGKGPADHVLQKPYSDMATKYALHKDELGSGQYGVIKKCMEIKTGKVYACKTIKKEGIKVSDGRRGEEGTFKAL